MKNILFIFIISIFIACEKEERITYKERELSIDSLELDSTMRLGDIANFKFYISYENKCGSLTSIIQENIVDTIVLRAYADYKEGNCLNIITADSAYFNYEARIRKTQYFKYTNRNGIVHYDSIKVK